MTPNPDHREATPLEANEADVIEQEIEVPDDDQIEDDDPDDAPVAHHLDLPDEVPEADGIEQAMEIGGDDGRR